VTDGRRLSCDEVRGLAPAFVLGALERDEEASVRAHLADCRDAHAEIAELGEVVPYLAETVEQLEPPPSLRGRILAAAAADTAAARSGRLDERQAPEPVRPIRIAHSPARPGRHGWMEASSSTWLLRAAAVLLIAVLGARNVVLQGQVSALVEFRAAVAAVAEAGAQSGALSAVLAGSSGASPRGVGSIRPDGSIVLALSGLAPTHGSQVYEAWLIPAGGSAIPVGSFGAGAEGTGVLQATGPRPAAGATLALTLEAGPGATKPTLPVLASGSVRGASA
jgi:anti-sigma-K factor RskA